MALNWVMVPDPPSPSRPYIPLPNERTMFVSNPRTSLSLTTPKSTYPAHTANLNITSSDGTLYLTNQRLLYLPKSNSTITTNTAKFQSFSCPLLNLHDTHLVVPWFGPNAWSALVQPVPGGNMYGTAAVELKFTFKEGGAPDFQNRFEEVKERLQQVVDVARERNVATGSSQIGLDMSNVHLDQLPSYQEHGQDRVANELSPIGSGNEGGSSSSRNVAPRARDTRESDDEMVVPHNATADEVRALAAAAATRRAQESTRRRSREEAEAGEQLTDAPPGYEETQQRGVEDEMARRLGGT